MRRVSRRAACCSLAAVAVGGCLTGRDDRDSISTEFDCVDAERPPSDVEPVERAWELGDGTYTVESVGGVAYPEPPDDFDSEDEITDFVERYERAYQRNAHAVERGDRLVSFTGHLDDATIASWRGDVAIVHLDLSVSTREIIDVPDGTHELLYNDLVPFEVAYAVDETGVLRQADRTETDEGPLEAGQLLECFE